MNINDLTKKIELENILEDISKTYWYCKKYPNFLLTAKNSFLETCQENSWLNPSLLYQYFQFKKSKEIFLFLGLLELGNFIVIYEINEKYMLTKITLNEFKKYLEKNEIIIKEK